MRSAYAQAKIPKLQRVMVALNVGGVLIVMVLLTLTLSAAEQYFGGGMPLSAMEANPR